MKFTVIILVGTFLMAAGLIFGLPKLSQEEAGEGRIEISPLEYQAGRVSMAAGLVKHTFEVKNSGQGDLKISGIKTSCMCTTAKLRVEGEESPEFGMHNNPTFWSEKIAAGQTGYLDVTFDPALHGPAGVGQVLRIIYLSTNDPEQKEAQARLTANVIQ